MLRRSLAVLLAGASLYASAAYAQDATWVGTTGNWNTNANWNPAAQPSGTAFFDVSPTTSVTFSASSNIDTIQFNAGAPAYTFTVTSGRFLEIEGLVGAGIVNNSSNAPNFTINFAFLQFDNTSTAGNATITNNGAVTFIDSSSAGSATIATGSGSFLLSFSDFSTAGNAVITTNSSDKTQFTTNSTGGNAQLIAIGTGIVDFSSSSGPDGINQLTAGSLAGSGLFYLGAKQLTVGSNNLSTIVSGIISDCGVGGTLCNASSATGGSLIKTGTGTLTLNGANTYTGGTTISAGILQLGNGGTAGSIVGNVTDNSIFAINRSDTFTFGGVISGTGSFQQIGPGTTIFTAANTYTGGTTILTGTLQLGNGGTSGSIVGDVVNRGVLNIVNANTAGITSIANIRGTTNFFNATTAGNAHINMSSNGTLQFFDQSTAGNAVIINSLGAATIFYGHSTAGNATIFDGGFGGTAFLDQSSAGSATIFNTRFAGVTFGDTSTAANATISNNDSLLFTGASTAGNATITNSISGTLSFSQNSSAGSSTIIDTTRTLFSDSSTAANSTITTNQLVFSNNSTAGAATITANGQLGFSDTSSGGSARLIINGALFISGLTNGGTTVGSIEGAGSIQLGANKLTVGSNGLSTEFSGTIVDGGLGGVGGSLAKVGTGTLTLTGNNTYTGGTTILGGTLQLGNGGASGSFVGNVVDNGVFAVNRSDVFTFGGVISGTGAFQQNGTGITKLTADNTYTGGTTINAGTLQLGSGGANATTGSIVRNVTDNGILAFGRSDAFTFAGVISGTGTVVQQGPGTTTLTGTNTYSGGTILNDGILAVASNANLGAVSGGLTFQGGTLRALASFNSARTVTLNAGGGTIGTDGFDVGWSGVVSGVGALTKNGGGVLTLLATDTYTGGTTISAGLLRLGNGGTAGSIVGDVTDNATFAVNRSDAYTFAGVISGTGAFQQAGTGTTILTGNSTYTGGTTIAAGTLQLGNGGGSGSIVGNVTNNGIFAINRSDTFTFTGVISGTGAFQQNGPGNTILTATNTYTGATVVNAGTLSVNGSIASSSGLDVNNGGAIGGTAAHSDRWPDNAPDDMGAVRGHRKCWRKCDRRARLNPA